MKGKTKWNHEEAKRVLAQLDAPAWGHSVDLNVGQSRFRCDLAVRAASDSMYQLGILVDTDAHYSNGNLLDRYLMQPSILRAFGWTFALVLTKDWYHNPDEVVARLEKLLRGEKPEEEAELKEEEPAEPVAQVAPEEPKPAAAPLAPKPAQPQPEPAPAEKAIASAASSDTGAVRHFEFIGGSSRKFWEISVSGNSFTVRFGRIGTAGQTQTKAFADEAKATHEAARLIAEKLRKGYTERA